MKILQLCHKPPYPPIDGGTKAMHYLTKALLDEGHSVKILCISTQKHPLDLKAIPAEYQKATGIEGIFADTSVNLVDAFTDLITMDNYNISRFFSPDMDIRLIQLLSREKFDLIQLESLYMTPYIPNIRRYSTAPIVLRSHNQEHVIHERIAKGEKNILKKPYRRFLAKQLKEHEMAVLDRVDAVAAISDIDKLKFEQHNSTTPIRTIPFGVDLADYSPSYEIKGVPTFFHLGSMDWLPNEEGIRWLLDKVWGRSHKKHPTARLFLAGNRMPKDLLRAGLPNVKVRGRVRDAQKFMTDHNVMLVPLFSAGGMRVKIIEGMALGKTIISTPIGAEGIEHEPGTDLLIARNAREFVDHMDALLENPERCALIGRQARARIETSYSHKKIVKELLDLYRSISK